MRKISAVFICFALFSIFSIPLYSQSSETEQSKAIHIVYDDSGSMIYDDEIKHEYLDRWAQNKYAMEIFAAMLEEKDTMSVYYMSHFDVITAQTMYKGNTNAPAGVEVSGYDLSNGVKNIHDMVTWALNTPYDAVKKAYEDLKKTDAEVKWLVVLSDGEFNQENGFYVPKGKEVDINKYFSDYVKESGVKIILLAMGDVADKLKINEDRKNIFFVQARNNDEILGQITGICNLIFNRSPYPFSTENMQELEFDLPTEILILAQGPNVEVNGLNNGKYVPSNRINVRYSEEAAKNFNKNDPDFKKKIPRDLTGVVATFQKIPKGKYSLDIKGAKKVDVYIKPDVNLQVKMYKNGREIRVNNKNKKKYFDDIYEGGHKFQYGIINDKGKFFEPEILNEIKYEIEEVVNNGQIIQIKSGDTVPLKQGDFSVHVKVRYLDNNFKEEIISGRVLAPLSCKARWEIFIKKFWFIFWPLVFLLLGLLLYWLLYGRKKRFPKYMSKKPVIKIETEENTIIKSGLFKIIRKTKWLPFCPERGTIVAVADGKPLPSLKVKAVGNNRMQLTNAGDFTPDKLNGVDFYINEQQLAEGSARSKEISCSSQIKSVYYGAGSATTYTCYFADAKKSSKRKK
jgi:hypothetical protein